MGYTVKLMKGLHSKDPNDIIKSEHVDTIEAIYEVISRYLIEINFKSYYQRIIQFPDEFAFVIDFGSHREFIDIICDQPIDYITYLNYK